MRHGESAPAKDGSPFPLVGGQADPELAPEGRDQAEHLAHRLAHDRLDGIVVTGLRRTAQTAAPLARKLAIMPHIEQDLREVYLGDWEGGVFRKMSAQAHPVIQRMWQEQRWDVIPDAESAEAFADRLRDAVARVAAAHPDQRLAVFTHGGVIAQLLAMASQSRPFAFLGADNGSVSQMVVTTNDWIVRRYNDVAHLANRA